MLCLKLECCPVPSHVQLRLEGLTFMHQVEDQAKTVTLEPKRGERAMIIKNASGDWGILIGRWDGYKVGVPGRRGNCTI